MFDHKAVCFINLLCFDY